MNSSRTPSLANRGFRTGAGGACEATLFRFTCTPGAQEPKSKDVAAVHLDDAYAYVRRRDPELRICQIETGELIEMVSGAPLD